MKYVDTAVTFSEVPDEITLCINISNCPCHCIGCHSSYLAQDIGDYLTADALDELVRKNKEISCIAFMGGDADPLFINDVAAYSKRKYKIKTAWYSGRDSLSPDINLKNFDYIKIGHFDRDAGPLNASTTNQRFYRIEENKLIDETYKFILQIIK